MANFLVVFDVDSTLINEEAIEVLAEQVGVRAEVAEITDLAMRGEIDFAESLRRRVAMLEGLPERQLQTVSEQLTLTRGAKSLIENVHSLGGKAAAVSGGFNQLLSGIKSELGLDFVRANDLIIQDGKLTGQVAEPIIDRAAKADFLKDLAASLDLTLTKVMAVGDGANDIDMIRVAGTGVAFCAKPALKQHADLIIDNRDLAELIPHLN